MSTPAFVGIDWGTTHRRAWLLDMHGAVLAAHRDDQGSLACRDRFAAALEELLARWPAARGVPVAMAGMVGSALGWQEVPYLDAAMPLADLPRHLVPVTERPAGARWWIVPGLSWRSTGGRPDVMRGEETQLLGAMALAPGDGWTVLPGTHSKWALLRGGSVTVLRTYMTGELFALLRERGTLAPLMTTSTTTEVGPAFDQGVRALGNDELSHALFGARARVVAGDAPAHEAAEYVSGLLMAAEWRHAARLGMPDAGAVRLVGEEALTERHDRCARHFGRRTEALDPEQVQLAAWRAMSRTLCETP